MTTSGEKVADETKQNSMILEELSIELSSSVSSCTEQHKKPNESSARKQENLLANSPSKSTHAAKTPLKSIRPSPTLEKNKKPSTSPRREFGTTELPQESSTFAGLEMRSRQEKQAKNFMHIGALSRMAQLNEAPLRQSTRKYVRKELLESQEQPPNSMAPKKHNFMVQRAEQPVLTRI